MIKPDILNNMLIVMLILLGIAFALMVAYILCENKKSKVGKLLQYFLVGFVTLHMSSATIVIAMAVQNIIYNI